MHKIAVIIDDNKLGGITTWANNFKKMFGDNVTIIECHTLKRIEKYMLKNIDTVICCLWGANAVDIYKSIHLNIITMVQSLVYKDSKFSDDDQIFMFKNSKHIVFTSKSEQEYFQERYPDIKVPSSVIYNVYVPEYSWRPYKHLDTVGYIGRFVPRKRPELAILGLDTIGRLDVPCLYMGRHDHSFWKELKEKYDNLELVPENFNIQAKDTFFDRVGIGSFTSIYEPFGYSLLEFIDRGIPVIVPDIDGPREIIEGFRDCVYPYEMHKDIDKDIESYSKVLERVLSLSPKERKRNAQKARGILERFTPEVISNDWNKLFKNILLL